MSTFDEVMAEEWWVHNSAGGVFDLCRETSDYDPRCDVFAKLLTEEQGGESFAGQEMLANIAVLGKRALALVLKHEWSASQVSTDCGVATAALWTDLDFSGAAARGRWAGGERLPKVFPGSVRARRRLRLGGRSARRPGRWRGRGDELAYIARTINIEALTVTTE